MIKVYYLPVERIDNTDIVKGSEYIHNALVRCTEKPNVRELIMDTTSDEDNALSVLALDVRAPNEKEVEAFNNLPPEGEPARDLGAEVDSQKVEIDALKIKVAELEKG